MLAFLSCKDQVTSDNYTPELGEIVLNNKRVPAGESISGSVVLENAPHINKYYLQVSGPKLEKTISLNFLNSKKANFEIADSLIQHSVQYRLIFFSNRGIIALDHFSVRPKEASGKIEMYTGPNSIWLAGKQKSMISAIVKDEFGNAVGDRSKVYYSMKYPSKDSRVLDDDVSDLYSSIEFTSEDEIGKILVGVSAGVAGSREQEILVIGDCPSQLLIETESLIPHADARQFLQLKTSQLRDRFENIIPDGTVVDFLIFENEKFYASYQSMTIDGVANVYIQNPDRETSWRIHARVCGYVLSNSIAISFDALFEQYSVQFNKSKNQLLVGPIKTKMGQYLADGTIVDFYFSSDELNYQKQIQLVDGKAVLELVNTSLSKGTYDVKVDVLGMGKQFKLTWSGV